MLRLRHILNRFEFNVPNVGLLLGVSALSTVTYSYYLKRQFFPACVYILRSPFSMTILVAFVLYLMVLSALIFKQILFGELRLIEREHLKERSWMTISELLLAATTFKDDLDSRFIASVTFMILVKMAHWILRDRIEFMEQTTQLPKGHNAYIVTVVYLLLAIDSSCIFSAVMNVRKNGASLCILYANEFALMLTSLLASTIRFGINLHDILRRGMSWEHRSTFLFYADFLIDMIKLCIYSVFFGLVVYFYGIPIHILRDLIITADSFVKRIRDIIRYRRAIKEMDTRYPTVTIPSGADRVCIICREEMTEGKKLGCGHYFHFRCLRSWLERQQACPTCRRQVLEDSKPHGSFSGVAATNVQRRQQQEQPQSPFLSPNNNQYHHQQHQHFEQNAERRSPVIISPPNVNMINRNNINTIERNLTPTPPSSNLISASNLGTPPMVGAVPVIFVPPDQIEADDNPNLRRINIENQDEPLLLRPIGNASGIELKGIQISHLEPAQLNSILRDSRSDLNSKLKRLLILRKELDQLLKKIQNFNEEFDKNDDNIVNENDNINEEK